MQTQIQLSTDEGGAITTQDTAQNVQIIHDAEIAPELLFWFFPINPFNGQIVSITSRNGVNALSIQSGTGNVYNAPTFLLAGESASFMYVISTNAWYKIS